MKPRWAAGSSDLPGGNVAAQGKHQVTINYECKEDGKRFGVKDAWSGTVAANQVELRIP